MTICDDCLAELGDPADRRFRHPFITCTNCGPRFTVTTGLPYDRPSTTMAALPDVRRVRPGVRRSRRTAASMPRPICCPDCGPRLRMVRPQREPAYDEDALREARSLLAAGAIVAVKGIGGYHLACDATNEDAVATLRKRKQRGDKPFAVMVADLATAPDRWSTSTTPRRRC